MKYSRTGKKENYHREVDRKKDKKEKEKNNENGRRTEEINER